MKEKINFLFKKFNRAPSSSVDISSNLLETFDVSGRRIIYNEEIYSENIPDSIPNFNTIFYYISNVDVAKVQGSTTIVSMNGVSNSTLVASHGLKEEIWQALRDNQIYSVEADSNSNIVKINDLVTNYVSDTNSILNSPSYFHPLLEDCIPNTIKYQVFDIIVKGKDSSGNIVLVSNNLDGDWIIQSDCGIIQFFDESGSIYDESGVNHVLFDNTTNTTSQALFNKAKTPIISFYKYIGMKGLGLQRTSDVIFKLPAQDGLTNSFLKTDGLGNLSFDQISGGGGGGSSVWTVAGNKVYLLNANVGIGNNNPAYNLDVDGNINFTGNLYNNGAAFGSTWTSSGNDIYFSTGNVSVGGTTNTDSSKFEVNGLVKLTNSNNGGILIGGNPNHAIYFNVGNDNNSNILDLHSSESIRFYTNGPISSQTEKVKIAQNGFVGIGSSSPSSKLDVNGDINLTGTLKKNGYIFLNEHKKTYNVTVATKTSSHPYYNNGSTKGYLLDGDESPVVQFKIGNTYRFNQNDSTNLTHQLLFYYDASRSLQFTTNVTTSGTAGYSGAYTEIQINEETPTKIYYQCINHSYMGHYGAIEVSIDNLTIKEIGYLNGVTSNIQTQINNSVSPWTSLNNNLYYNNGNIGLGTINPSSLLDLSGIAKDTVIQTWSYVQGTNNYRHLTLKSPASSTSDPWIIQTSNSLKFLCDNNNGLFINQNGKVSINHDNPTEYLDISGNIKLSGSLKTSSIELTQTELGYLDGISSNLQTQINNLQSFDTSLGTDITNINQTKWIENGNDIYNRVGAGNVGIGLNNPSYKLDVVGDINFSGNLLKNGNAYSSGSGSLWTSSGNNLYFSNGSIGIGNSNPEFKLDVSGKGYFNDNVKIKSNGDTPTENSDLLIGTNSSSNTFPSSSNRLSYRTPGHGRYFTWKTNDPDGTFSDLQLLINFSPSSIMTWRNNYRVGINNNTPAYTLDVIGDINFTGNMYKNGSVYGSGGGSSSLWSNSGSDIYYNTGKVGVGTTTPTSGLSVVTDGRTNSSHPVGVHLGKDSNIAYIELCESIGGNVDFSTGDSSNDFNGRISYTHSGNYMTFFTNGNNERLRINSIGNIGIGNNNPSQKLDVDGNVNFTGNLYQNGSLYTSPVVHKKIYNVTVTSKTSDHPYYNTGSSLGYFIDDQHSPVIQFKVGNTYRFNQNDSTNSSHQLRFYNDVAKSSAYTSNVTYNGTAGSSGAYTEIQITASTPTKLYYQCVNHGYMGNYGAVEISIDNLTSTEIGYLNGVTSGIQTQFSGITSSQWTTNSSNIYYSTGNVGIGILSPNEKLHVDAGNILISNTSSKQPKMIFEKISSDNNVIVEYDGSSSTASSNYLAFYSGTNGWSTKGSSLNIIPNNGRVGIGTITPQSLLDVNGVIRASYNTDTTSYFGRAAVGGGIAGASDCADFAHIDHYSENNYSLRQNNSGTTIINAPSGSSGIQFNINDSTKMIIDTNGEIGINVSNPSYKLDVNGDINFTGNLLKNGGSFSVSHKTTFNVTVSSKSSNHPYYGNGSGSGYYIDGDESPVLQFKVGKTYRFNQNDSTNSNHPFRFYNDAGKSSQYTTGVTTSGSAGNSGAYVEITISNSTPSKLYYQCQYHGYMGNYGAIEISIDNLTSTEIGYLDGVTSSIQTQINNNSSSSDDRVKHNEIIITNALEEIRKLVPKKYFKTENLYDANHNFLLDNSNNPIDSSGNVIDCIVEAGLIAQEVLKIPNLSFSVVDPVNENSPYGVRYNNILTYSVAALKELDQTFSNNKNELNKKTEKITNLETKVKNLEKQLNDEKTKVKTLQFQMSDVLNRLHTLESNKS